ncbi:MAG: M48 family metalloprotease [Candidatus Pacebacteria bacterium]|nr:M48 family metalloprotease [Candidatus Paceibacterota bacterium]
MATLYTQQSSNITKTFMLMGAFLVLVIAICYFVSIYFGNSVILYVGAIFAVLTSVGSYWFSDKIVLSMTGAHEITKEQAPDLYNVVENLSITAGLPMPKVYIVDDPSPNAFATGRDPEHAVVAATTGLLQVLDRTELEGVMAHELSHVGNRDMLVMTVAVVLAGFVAIVADFFSRSLIHGGGNNRDRHPAFLIIGIIGIILAPLAAKMIQLAISRKREYLADATGALLTRYPEGLASALEKISAHAQPMQRASHATAHLFISDPFQDGRLGVMQKISGLFQTHPPVAERIKYLRGMDT